MAKYIADLLAKIQSPGMPPIREIKVRDKAGIQQNVSAAEAVTGIEVNGGILWIEVTTDV